MRCGTMRWRRTPCTERRFVFSKRAGSFVCRSSDFSIVISKSGYKTPNVARRRVGSRSFRHVFSMGFGLIFGPAAPVHGSAIRLFPVITPQQSRELPLTSRLIKHVLRDRGADRLTDGSWRTCPCRSLPNNLTDSYERNIAQAGLY